ncbi:MAG: hypothetical protein N3E49_05455 [Bacteroidia bacterium]|nr:hypothetical protein [Bacteroidia bacterium]
MTFVRTAHSCAALTVIIGSFGWCSLRGQDTVGLYFSARGFQFDPYYRMAILSSDQEVITGKAAFLLSLIDSLAERVSDSTYLILNLHRHPTLAGYIENPERLPPHWAGLFYVERMDLQAKPHTVVFARSNRLYTERSYTLSYQIEGIFFSKGQALPFREKGEMVELEWRSHLLHVLRQQVQSFLTR